MDKFLISQRIIMTDDLSTGFFQWQGGMKTVVYTDCLQMAIIVAGLVALCALGSEVGWLEIWDVALANGRINLNTLVDLLNCICLLSYLNMKYL